jgi:hypothetical protein
MDRIKRNDHPLLASIGNHLSFIRLDAHNGNDVNILHPSTGLILKRAPKHITVTHFISTTTL